MYVDYIKATSLKVTMLKLWPMLRKYVLYTVEQQKSYFGKNLKDATGKGKAW